MGKRSFKQPFLQDFFFHHRICENFGDNFENFETLFKIQYGYIISTYPIYVELDLNNQPQMIY